MSVDQELTSLAAIQASFKKMEERLSNVCNNVESLKKTKQLVAQLPYIIEYTGTVHSTLAQSALNMPVVGDVVGDKVIIGLSGGERMKLEDNPEDPASNITGKKPGGDKVNLTQVHESTEDIKCYCTKSCSCNKMQTHVNKKKLIISDGYSLMEHSRYDMLESGGNAFVNYNVTTFEVNTSSVICTGNINCDVSGVQISNISNTKMTGDNKCTIPDVSTVPD